ncbi:MAG: serine/threonine-protein phosphatase [Gammaproteobacteria bacterium]|nr:serine/threonine-protein phosphatase [Gammaproteobacteria bacterium]MBT3724822.1 serine/threonine-protein phosphatase [Gammaproteobacteria bacterium]MBT4075587.1 serine/threonine-protein phosphatase [Gammaproteobacteria bacterium]MBT4194875.1 serine/threonine-protein phosphatase [Gammaproteobacteria bacterium]MBT4448074.1 serine/threonine-protein phosphatase [Gammaproteobacteria bacterium]
MSVYNNNKTAPPSFKFSYSGLTDTGHVRSRNEDSFACVPTQNLWVVADGMGGHESGDFASQTITTQAEKFIQQPALETSLLLLEENLLHSNKIIREKAEKLGKNMTIGSTVTCLYTWKNLAFFLWAGDSRAYRFRNHTLERLTEDHSYVEELVKMGKINSAEAESHPAANVVLNAIGIDNDIVIDMEYAEIEDDDLFILCSDGLYKDLAEAQISNIIDKNEASIEELNRNLISAALDVAGSDNCTVVLVKASLENKDD